MRRADLEEFIQQNNLLTEVEHKPGIYAITIDGKIAYVGQSKNMYERCGQHIYNIQNAMLNEEKKYELLLAAKLGGHTVDCCPIAYCEQKELSKKEAEAITKFAPALNIATPTGINDISELTIEELMDKIHWKKKDEVEQDA